jgi:hypothetical protein
LSCMEKAAIFAPVPIWPTLPSPTPRRFLASRGSRQLDLNPAFEAENRSHEQMVAVLVSGWPGVRCDLVLVVAEANRRSSRLPNTLGESNRGTQSQSIDPSGATSAPVWQFDKNA